MDDVIVQPWAGNQPDADPDRCLLVLPGRRFPVELAPLGLPMRALALQGWTVVHARWDLDDASPDVQRAAVHEAIRGLDALTRPARHRVVLGTSLGSLAAGWAADHRVPAVWLTPLLTDEGCAAGLARAAAPVLLVAGSRDHTWDDAVARRLDLPALRLPGADHALQVGDWRREVDILHEVTGAVERFVGAVAPASGGPGPH